MQYSIEEVDGFLAKDPVYSDPAQCQEMIDRIDGLLPPLSSPLNISLFDTDIEKHTELLINLCARGGIKTTAHSEPGPTGRDFLNCYSMLVKYRAHEKDVNPQYSPPLATHLHS